MLQRLRDLSLVSVSVALFAGVLLSRVLDVSPYLGGLLGSPERDTVMVVVAARDLSPGVVIEEGDLYALAMRPEHIPDGAFVAPAHVVGRVPHEKILQNELVRGARLYQPGLSGGIDALLPRGLRAVSIVLGSEGALAGALRPSNYVDVIERSEAGEVRTLAEGLFVLESRPVGSEVAVVLLADTSQAERLASVSDTRSLSLSLRNGRDAELYMRYGTPRGELYEGYFSATEGLAEILEPKAIERRPPLKRRRCTEYSFIAEFSGERVRCD